MSDPYGSRGPDPAGSAAGGAAELPHDDRWFAPAGPSRRRAILVLVGLVAVAASMVAAAILFTGDPAAGPSGEVADPEVGAAPTEDPAGSSDGPEQPPIEDLPEGEGEVTGEAEGSPNGGPVEVDFDGACTAEVAASDLHRDLRPWDHAACTSAPISLLDADDQRWIVVLASLSDDAFDEAAARDHAVAERLGEEVLWSSHYPSLNPGFWVVYDGPFADEDGASAAAEQHGGGAYVRRLIDEDDARYCHVEDGCDPDR